MNVILSQQDYTFTSRIINSIIDLKDGVKKWRVWLLLAWQDIQLRYRRSVLGPFWITLSMAITICMTGLLYGTLFKISLDRYFPYFASGMLIWSFVSVSISEGTNIFFESERFLKQMKLPYSVFIFRTVARNFIIFLHNFVIFIPIMFIFHLQINSNIFIGIYGLLLIILNAIAAGFILAIYGTRFRDISQIVTSLSQVLFFLTPVIWSPSILPEKYLFIVYLNPFAQFLEMIRNPLLGLPPSGYAYITTLVLTLLNLTLAFTLFSRVRTRIAYWL